MKILFLMHSFEQSHGVGVLTYDLTRKMNVVVIDRAFGEKYEIKEKIVDSTRVYTVVSPAPENNMMRDHVYCDDKIIELLDQICKKEQGFSIVNIHHLTNWPLNTIDYFKEYSIVLSIHDTYAICPSLSYYNRTSQKVCSKTLREASGCSGCLRDLGLYRFKNNFSLTWYEQNIRRISPPFDKVDAVVYPTIKCKSHYINEGLVHTTTRIIPYFLDIQPVQKSKNQYFTFGFISNIGYGKGLETALNAFSEIRDPDIRFHIYGAIHDSNLEPMIRLAVNSDARIEYKGGYKNVSDIISGIDTVIVPSYFPESFNLCSYAAVVNKIPLIVSDLAYHEEFLKDGTNCFVFKNRDHLDLAAKMKKRMNAPGFVVEENKFSNDYMNLYKEILESKGSYLPCQLIYIVRDYEDIENLFRIKFDSVKIFCDSSIKLPELPNADIKYKIKNIGDYITDNTILRLSKTKISDKNILKSYKSEFNKRGFTYVDDNGYLTEEKTGLVFIGKGANFDYHID